MFLHISIAKSVLLSEQFPSNAVQLSDLDKLGSKDMQRMWSQQCLMYLSVFLIVIDDCIRSCWLVCNDDSIN